MEILKRLSALMRIRKTYQSAGMGEFSMTPIVTPIIDLNDNNWKYKCKTAVLDLSGTAGNHVAAIWADNGRKIKIISAWRGATTGNSSITAFAEQNGAIARISTSSTGQSMMAVHTDFIIDEGSFGMMATANGADTAIDLHIVYLEEETT